MKISKTKLLVAGLLAGSLTFVGCKSDKSGETGGTDTTQGTGTGTDTGTGTGTGATGTDTGTGTGTGTGTDPGTGGAGMDPSQTKQTDDNMRMPEEDPLRTPEQDPLGTPENEGIREAEPGVHDDTMDPGTGGAGGAGMGDDTMDAPLNEGGNINDDFQVPDSPSHTLPEGQMTDDSQIPEGTR
jgi:hypothetical protein